MTYYCYILYNDENNKTYNGYTVNTKKRIRQHNSEIKGGAKYTTKANVIWKYLLIIESTEFTKHTALCFEWMMKFPTRKKPRPKNYQGIIGRINSLPLVFSYELFNNMQFIIRTNIEYINEISNKLKDYNNIIITCL
jgi:predicted GIY-YIG superfamily endonuclease